MVFKNTETCVTQYLLDASLFLSKRRSLSIKNTCIILHAIVDVDVSFLSLVIIICKSQTFQIWNVFLCLMLNTPTFELISWFSCFNSKIHSGLLKIFIICLHIMFQLRNRIKLFVLYSFMVIFISRLESKLDWNCRKGLCLLWIL